ncbi:DUF4922 domain-containing protein [Prevotella sp. 10(H)]|uniref:DUF4922 domain-containing protein n=1 Tax=Prevotella sp. 10(H) TaxID=1158294 RepID=UPI0004A6C9FA|nr:DUF4922 domain-containing protein [Prevotella sp. 10(H)]
MSILSQQIKELFDSQLREWEQAKTNYEALKKVKTRNFSFGSFSVKVQFNPARMHSASAKVDAVSIQERKCFLCPQNLPEQQKGIPYEEEYQILVNPFPIFPVHYTIPTCEHTDQLILNRFGDMVNLAEELPEYTIFYNGPKAGASAPDHAHFQAGIKGFLPIEKDIYPLEKDVIYESGDILIYAVKSYLRNFFLLRSKDKERIKIYFEKLYSLLEIKEDDKEPKMNILGWHVEGEYYFCIFPREKHRPDCFFANDDTQILVSPGAVDMGGVLIVPQEKDFNKITAADIEDIYKEICISDEEMQLIIDKVKQI